MEFITKDYFVDALELSTRTNNCLRRAGIHTVGDLFSYIKKHDLTTIYGMGRLSVNEVKQIVEELKNGTNTKYVLIDKSDLYIDRKAQENKNLEEVKKECLLISSDSFDDDIEEKLAEKGIFLYTQLWDKSISEIYSLGIVENKSVWSLLYKTIEIRELYGNAKSQEAKYILENRKKLNDIIEEFVPFLNRNKNVAALQILHIFTANRTNEELFFEELINYEPIKEYLKEKVFSLFEKNISIEKNEVLAILPDYLQNIKKSEKLFEIMKKEKIISIEKDKIKLYLPTFFEILEKTENERTKAIIKSRFSGKTLEEVANEYEITRERVRQIISKVIENIPPVKEDAYRYLFETYLINEDEFCTAFSEPMETYMYLKTICGVKLCDKKEIDEELLFDEKISVQMKKMLEPIIYKDYVRTGTAVIKKTRPELVKYVVKKYCKNLTKYDKFQEIYKNFLKEKGIYNEETLRIEDRAYMNQLTDSMYVLWNQKRSFRYYDINGQDYEDLFDTLDLEQYENVELSTLKFIKDYPKLMERYDIHDEYELHNLLKKIISQENKNIAFGRMPTIEFGKPDTDNQVLELLLQYAPISVKELAKKYEEKYGVKFETVMGSYLRNFDDYFFDGIYAISADNLPFEEFEKMKEILTQDCYAIMEIKQLYKTHFPYESMSAINPYTLKTLGFKVYSDYVVRNTYDSANSYFKHMLTKDDIIDTSNLNRHIRNCVTFTSTVYELCQNYEIVEFEPHKYINIRKLNERGITKELLKDYCNAVASKVKDGEFFTVTSLRNEGFTHELDNAGYGYWFYVSVLAEDYKHFSCRRMGKTRLFYKGHEKIRMSDMLSVLLAIKKYMYLNDLNELLANHYNIHMNVYKIIELIKETDLHYDPIDKKVYLNYETYELMK